MDVYSLSITILESIQIQKGVKNGISLSKNSANMFLDARLINTTRIMHIPKWHWRLHPHIFYFNQIMNEISVSQEDSKSQ